MSKFIPDITIKITDYLDDKDSVKWLTVDNANYKLIEYYHLKSFYNYDFNTKCVMDHILYHCKEEFVCGDKFKDIKSLELGKFDMESQYDSDDDRYEDIDNSIYYNASIVDMPKNLENLTIYSESFNESLDNLPKTLKNLHIDSPFDQKINNLPNLIALTLNSYHFIQPIDMLPDSLEFLDININNKRNRDGPVNIYIHDHNDDDIEYAMTELPKNLKTLDLCTTYKITLKLPPNLTSFRYNHIPPNLILPSSLTKLHLGKYIDDHITCDIPYLPNLKILKLYDPLDYKLDNVLKSTSLEELLICDSVYNHTPVNLILDSYPKNLQKLSIGWHFNQSFDNLPETLRKLEFIGIFDHSINDLPDHIEIVEFVAKYGTHCNFSHNTNKYPKNLKELRIPNKIKDCFIDIPENVKFVIKNDENDFPKIIIGL